MSETVDAGADVGLYTSLALQVTPPYTPHVAYWSDGVLKHAIRTGSGWVGETVDGGEDVGRFPSMALDGSGRAFIAYYDRVNGDLKVARRGQRVFLPLVLRGYP